MSSRHITKIGITTLHTVAIKALYNLSCILYGKILKGVLGVICPFWRSHWALVPSVTVLWGSGHWGLEAFSFVEVQMPRSQVWCGPRDNLLFWDKAVCVSCLSQAPPLSSWVEAAPGSHQTKVNKCSRIVNQSKPFFLQITQSRYFVTATKRDSDCFKASLIQIFVKPPDVIFYDLSLQNNRMAMIPPVFFNLPVSENTDQNVKKKTKQKP